MTDFYSSEPFGDDSDSVFGERFASARRFRDLTPPAVDGAESELLPAHPEIVELIESLLAADPDLQPGSEITAAERPHAVFLPEHYEAGYAYPLVVWFHSDGATESEVGEVMPLISDRNYLGVALRGNVAVGEGFGWSADAVDSTTLIQDVRAIVTSLRRQYHIHSERIYLAGFGTGATTALQVMLRKPEWFGGVISFSGELPDTDTARLSLDDLKDKRILLTASLSASATRVGDVVAAGRLLYSAGIQVGTRVYQGGETRPTSKMLRDLNSWLMDDICGNVKATT